MRRIIVAVTIAILVSSIPASSQIRDSRDVAMELGDVLGSEAFCGVSYRADAVANYIKDNVAEDDMGFSSALRTLTDATSYSLGEMSDIAKVAHCTQIKRVAKANGFTD